MPIKPNPPWGGGGKRRGLLYSQTIDFFWGRRRPGCRSRWLL